MPHGDSLILTLVGGFVLAFVFGMLALRLKLSPLVGYILAGVVVGPFTPGYVADGGVATQLAEVGVILLMFGVGLHFSPKDLLQVRSVAVPGALLQILLATLLGWGLGALLGLGLVESLLIGFSLSVASTVVVLRTLEDRKLLSAEIGRIAVGWLVVQDLVVIVALVLLPLLVGEQTLAPLALAGEIGWKLLKVALFVALMFVVGGRVLPWVLVRIAHTRSRELFTLGVLSIAMGIAYLAYAVFGASFALGAFVAGLVLNGTALGHNAAERSLPFRDAFAVLFFVSVGMLFDPRILAREPLAAAAVVLIVLVSAMVAALVVAKVARMSWADRSLLAAVMPQVGEFSFVIAGLGLTLGALSRESYGLVVAGAILSIALNPVILTIIDRMARARATARAAETTDPAPQTPPA
ncbi:MAG TPA: cation:proton antiporter [Caulobacteraceae bacterium]|nr:cation:proton antiporter [Caulobacteraceae bacterium]